MLWQKKASCGGAVLPHISRRLLLVIVRRVFYAFCGEQLPAAARVNIDAAKHAWAILANLEAADDSSSGQMLKTGTRAACGLDPPNRKSQLRFGEILLCFVENLPLGPRCRRHLLGARHRCDLLRGLTGLRLRRLSPCVVALPITVLAGFPALFHVLPQAPRQVRQLF